MAFTEKDLKEFLKNELRLVDTFNFECAMCGKCCRNRAEPIMLTGADIFRIAKALGKPVDETISENTSCHIGDSSHVPVITLKERLDGSCRLLRKGRCMVHQDKPVVCALFPLGRYFDGRDGTFHYFMNKNTCQPSQSGGKQWTLQEWLDEFKIEETEAMTAAWNKLLGGLSTVTHRMPKEKIYGRMLEVLLGALYFSYDTSKPYIEQVEFNMELVKAVFEREFHKKVVYDIGGGNGKT